uniref:lipoprotein-releasing ABC transporter permease subunit LolE n=1 Tax=Thaumasiovibrio occultus TaxID=1891184 RepID=UPI000B35B335|nr:lipoprotein-releasing ABC transporter permease subunit LolE [Thaumasiovibrio occultus]
MRKPLSLFIGGRFTRAKKQNRMVSFISISSVIGIAVGVAVIILGLSAMNGFEKELRERVLSVIPHGELEAVNSPMGQWPQISARLTQSDGIVAAAPYVKLTGLLEKGEQLKAVQIRGVVPTLEDDISSLSSFIGGDAWQTFESGKQQVILGKGVADVLGVKQGDWLTVLVPDSDPGRQLRSPQRLRLQVHGILELGGQIDHNLAIVPMADAQSYLGWDDKVTGVAVKVSDVMQAPALVTIAGNTLPVAVYLKHWQLQFGYLYRDIQMVRLIMHIVMVLVIGVACFNIVSTLMMAVKERAGEVAILRTMGATDKLISRIFVWHGVLSGAMGCLIGGVAGTLLSINLPHLAKGIESITGKPLLSGDIYFVNFLPSQLYMSDVVVVTGTALLLSLLATWYPARRAAALNPAEVLSAK